MTGLLVSVRDAAEALAATRGGAALIDVKEPLHGSLGAAAPEVWRQVRAALPPHVPCSAALGELRDIMPQQVPEWRSSLAGYQFAKLGLSGCREVSDWQSRWREIMQDLPPETGRVAVVYADWKSAVAPPPDEVLQAASKFSCAALLVDTFDKTRGSLTAHLSYQEIQRILFAAREAGLKTVLAGSLTLALARELLPLAADFLAVRGAVCRGDRTGEVDQRLVAEFAELLLSTREEANHFSAPAKATFAA
jgi:uncharacterized protein (UPF0264 family)